MTNIFGQDIDWVNEPSSKKKETRGKPLMWIPSADQPDPKFFTGTVDDKQYMGEPVEKLKKKQPSVQEFQEAIGL